jgi:hypothetical protein
MKLIPKPTLTFCYIYLTFCKAQSIFSALEERGRGESPKVNAFQKDIQTNFSPQLVRF